MRHLRLTLVFAAALLPWLYPSPSHSRDIGDAIEREYGIVTSDTPEGREMNELLERVVSKIGPAAGLMPKSARILGTGRRERHKGEINALALPDGRIYVMSGLIEAAKAGSDPEAEVAFVVGHEITHVAEKHGKRQAKRNFLNSLGSVLLGVVTGGASLVRIGGDIYVNAMAGHYSRKDEYAADRGALKAMAKAGYPIDAAAAMLERIRAKYGDKGTGGPLGWFRSHPPTKNRIKQVKELAASPEIRSGGPFLAPAAPPEPGAVEVPARGDEPRGEEEKD